MSEATGHVIVDQAGGLHVCIHDCATDEFEAAFFEVFAERIRLCRRSGYIAVFLESILNRLAVHEAPNVLAEATKLFLHRNKSFGVANGGLDLESVTNNCRVQQNFRNAFWREASHLLHIEVSE